jgi:hypothetical protein
VAMEMCRVDGRFALPDMCGFPPVGSAFLASACSIQPHANHEFLQHAALRNEWCWATLVVGEERDGRP